MFKALWVLSNCCHDNHVRMCKKKKKKHIQSVRHILELYLYERCQEYIGGQTA